MTRGAVITGVDGGATIARGAPQVQGAPALQPHTHSAEQGQVFACRIGFVTGVTNGGTGASNGAGARSGRGACDTGPTDASASSTVIIMTHPSSGSGVFWSSVTTARTAHQPPIAEP